MIASAPSSPSWRVRWFWIVALVVTAVGYGAAYRQVVANPDRVGDFFQDWASARNYFEGLPIYTPQAETAERYLGYRHDPRNGVFVRVNGHPPASVLAALPLAKLSYRDAYWLWSAISLALFFAVAAAALRFETGTFGSWYWLPLLTVACGNPLVQHLLMGQLSLVIAALVVGIAIADDRGRHVLCGVLWGTAVALKLFPIALVVYFLALRRGRTILAGSVTAAAWVGASFYLFGSQTYADYVQTAMPEVLRYRDWWLNYSVTGMWYKLFEGASGQALPIVAAPEIARYGAMLTIAAILASAAWIAWCSRGRGDARRTSLAVAVVAMLLASPITWDHYFLILLWPMLRIGIRLPQSTLLHAAYGAALFAFWLNPYVLFAYVTRGGRMISSGQTLAVISWPFYALCLAFLLGALAARRFAQQTSNDSRSTSPTAGRAAAATEVVVG
jgi:hypothetical protein